MMRSAMSKSFDGQDRDSQDWYLQDSQRFCWQEIIKELATSYKTPSSLSIFNKFSGGAYNFIKKETLAQVFCYEFC